MESRNGRWVGEEGSHVYNQSITLDKRPSWLDTCNELDSSIPTCCHLPTSSSPAHYVLYYIYYCYYMQRPARTLDYDTELARQKQYGFR